MEKSYDFNKAFAEAYIELIGPKTNEPVSTEAQILYTKGVDGLRLYINLKRLHDRAKDLDKSIMKSKKSLREINSLASRLN